MLTDIISLPPRVSSGYINRTFSFDKPNHLGYCIFGWNRNHHVHVIGHHMPFFYQTLFLPGQPMEHLTKFLFDLPENYFLTVFRDEHNMILTLLARVA